MVVQIVTDVEFGQWLEIEWENVFDWDAGNSEKLAKHNLTPKQVENLFDEGTALYAGRVAPKPDETWCEFESRHMILLLSQEGKHFTLFCTRRSDKLRPISCRSSRDEEKRFYNDTRRSHDGRGA